MKKDLTISIPRGTLKKVKIGKGNFNVSLEWNRAFRNQYEKGFSKAQKILDNRVLTDSTAFIPIDSGFLRESGTLGTVIGSGEVIWLAPYAHYLYVGKTMVGVSSKKAWANDKEPKEYNGGTLTYQQGGAEWFERAKEQYKDSWISAVRKEIGGV